MHGGVDVLDIDNLLTSIVNYVKKNGYFLQREDNIIIVPNNNKELLQAINIDNSILRVISPRKFEELIAYIYRISGYNVQITKATRDRGADVLVWSPPPLFGKEFLTIIEAKKYNNENKVTFSDIQKLMGARVTFNANKAQMLTTYGFTKDAMELAQTNEIDLALFEELLAKLNNFK